MWIEQADESGDIFRDAYLHPQCEYIRHWESREEWLKEIKEENADNNSKRG